MLSEVPEGWGLKRLDSLSEGGIRNGIFKKRHDFGDGVPLVNVLDCFSGPPVDLEELERVRVSRGELRRFDVADGDLLFIRSSLNVQGIGHSAIILALSEPTVYECHIMRIRPVAEAAPQLLYHYSKGYDFRRRIMGNAQTTTMTTLPQDGLGVIKIPLPPPPRTAQDCGDFGVGG